MPEPVWSLYRSGELSGLGIYEPSFWNTSEGRIVTIGYQNNSDDKLWTETLWAVKNATRVYLQQHGVKHPARVNRLVTAYFDQSRLIENYDMSTAPEKGDALDHLDGASLVIGFHLWYAPHPGYHSRGEWKNNYYGSMIYNRNNRELLRLKDRYGFLFIALGEQP